MTEEIWAPHLHKAEDKAIVGPWLLGVLNATHRFVPFEAEELFLPDREIKYTLHGEERTAERVAMNPEVTHRLLVLIGEMDIPGQTLREEALALRFFADQWVGILSTAVLGGEENSLWVEADDFTLGLAKTLEVWREKIKAQAGGSQLG
jgi:hypothetical protein